MRPDVYISGLPVVYIFATELSPRGGVYILIGLYFGYEFVNQAPEQLTHAPERRRLSITLQSPL